MSIKSLATIMALFSLTVCNKIDAQNVTLPDSSRTLSGDSLSYRLTIPANYAASDSMLRLAIQTARLLGPKVELIDVATTIREFIRERYNVRREAKSAIEKRAYASIDSMLRAANSWGPLRNRVDTGTLNVPQLPAFVSNVGIAPTPLDSHNVNLVTAPVPNQITNLSGSALGSERSDSLMQNPISTFVSAKVAVAPESAPAKRIEINRACERREPLCQYISHDRSGSKFTASVDDQGFSQFEISTRIVSDAAQKLQNYARGRIVRKGIPLIILDSGWPDSLTRDSSIARVLRMTDETRRAWNLGSRTFRHLNDRPFKEPSNRHVTVIQEALSPFSRLFEGDSGAIDIIYFPLTVDAQSRPVIKEILLVNALLYAKKEKATASCPGFLTIEQQLECVSNRDVPNNELELSDMLEEQLDSMQFSPQNSTGDTDSTFTSSATILEAILSVLDVNSVTSGTLAIVNTSWTADNILFLHWNLRFQLSRRVLLVAALGNRSQEVLSSTSIQPASMAFDSGNALAVANMVQSDQVACRSNYITESLPSLSRTVGFTGAVDGGMCGTSFSAPRIALFLALTEALRPAKVSSWIADNLSESIKDFRRENGEAVLIDPVRFLNFQVSRWRY